MTRTPSSFEDIPAMADEVAILMASRFGGAKRGERPPLDQMMRRRGGALPAGLRRRARRLADAGRMAAQPKVARQLPLDGLARDHAALVRASATLGRDLALAGAGDRVCGLGRAGVAGAGGRGAVDHGPAGHALAPHAQGATLTFAAGVLPKPGQAVSWAANPIRAQDRPMTQKSEFRAA